MRAWIPGIRPTSPRTGVAVSAGAQTRRAGIFAGVWLALLVLLAGSVAELIPMPVIGGLILVIGVELVAGRMDDIKLVLRTAPLSAVAMIVTFSATTELPSHTAILIGAITSLVLYCVKASRSASLTALRRWASDLNANGGRLIIAGVSPATARELELGGIAELVGADDIPPVTALVFGAVGEAVARGEAWIRRRPDAGPSA